MRDPIFAAIETRKRAMENFKAVVRRVPDGDAPADAVNALADAGCAMLGTRPATMAGARALVRYVWDCEGCGEQVLRLKIGNDLGGKVLAKNLFATLVAGR